MSLQEEPFSHPPQQQKKPEMSVTEDSDIMGMLSARNPRKVTDMSIFSMADNDQQMQTQDNQNQLSQTMQTNPSQPNPFLSTPVAPQTTIE